MEGVQFLTNEKGERTGLVLDFLKLRNKSQNKVREYFEDLEDIIVCELRKNEPHTSWEVAKQELKAKGVID